MVWEKHMRKIRKCWEDKKTLCLYKGESYLNKHVNGWKILKYHSTKEKPSGSRVDWLCECLSCGLQKQLPMYNIISGRSKKCFDCANKNKDGKNNNNWKGVGDIPSSLITSIKHGAYSRNLSMEVDGEYLNKLWEEQNHKCALTGLDLIMKAKSTKDDPWSNRASLDRKNALLGYISGNVRWVHPIVNIMKNQFDDDIFISMCRKVVENVDNIKANKDQPSCTAGACEIVDLTK